MTVIQTRQGADHGSQDRPRRAGDGSIVRNRGGRRTRPRRRWVHGVRDEPHSDPGREARGSGFLPLDVTDDESVADAVREVLDRSGRIDVLVNNAGLGVAGAAEESSVEQARALFETNLFGSIRMTRAVLPHMREQRSGRIINVSSIVGLIPVPYMALYASSKHALEGYSESIDHEVREHGVRVLLVGARVHQDLLRRESRCRRHTASVYAQQRKIVDAGLADALKAGDGHRSSGTPSSPPPPTQRPKLRYPAGKTARRVSKARRYAPTTVFDKQIRKLNQLPA
jgi:Short-chain dehydrogenases of various substrate specificities